MTEPVPLLGGYFYHIYNRGNNRETVFRTPENYRFFMDRYIHHVEPVAATFAYCLLPNHLHLLVYIRTDSEQQSWHDAQGNELPASWQPLPAHRAFKNLFISYSMAFNRRYERTGSLFQKPFKRKHVDSDRYFTALVAYIHRNPQKHGLIDDYRGWPYSSYRAMLTETETRLQRSEVLRWFGGRSSFIDAHMSTVDEVLIAPFIVD